MDAEQKTWGVEINRRGYGSQPMPELCLEWATPFDKDDWQKKGVIVWSHNAQRVEALSAANALEYLDHMRNNDDWQLAGIPILRQSTVLKLENTGQKKGKGKTADEEGRGAEEKTSQPETVVEERFRLSPDQSVAFLQFLERNEVALKEMADEDEATRLKAFYQVYSILA